MQNLYMFRKLIFLIFFYGVLISEHFKTELPVEKNITDSHIFSLLNRKMAIASHHKTAEPSQTYPSRKDAELVWFLLPAPIRPWMPKVTLVAGACGTATRRRSGLASFQLNWTWGLDNFSTEEISQANFSWFCTREKLIWIGSLKTYLSRHHL